MHAETESGDTHQQWQNDTYDHQDLVLCVDAQTGKHRHRFGRVYTRERKTLCRDIVDICFAVGSFETFDPFVIKIRSAPHEDIFDHTTQRHGEQQVDPYSLAELLVPTPIQKTDDRHTDQVFAKHGKKRGYRNADCTEPGLDPLHQGYFPFKVKCISVHIAVPSKLSLII